MARQIELSLDAPDTLPARLDLPALESIVHNLIDNAARYHRASGHVAVGLRQAGALLHLVAFLALKDPKANPSDIFTMLTGDLVGTLVVLYAYKLLLIALPARLRHLR